MGLKPGMMEDKTKPMENGSAMARRSVTSTAETHPNKERDQLRQEVLTNSEDIKTIK
jgi:hypothetical protein